MTQANAIKDTKIVQGKEALQTQLANLDDTAQGYALQCKNIQQQFDKLNVDTPAQTTLPLLLNFLEMKRIDPGL